MEQHNVNPLNESQLKAKLRQDIEAIGTDGEYMTEQHIAAFKHYLVNLDALLVEKASQTKQLIKDTRQDGADEADAAELQIELDKNRQREFSITLQQKSIRTAFEAIRNDEFGYCCSCGAEIGYDRMLSMPWSVRDADCARLHELKMLQNTGSYRVSAPA